MLQSRVRRDKSHLLLFVDKIKEQKTFRLSDYIVDANKQVGSLKVLYNVLSGNGKITLFLSSTSQSDPDIAFFTDFFKGWLES